MGYPTKLEVPLKEYGYHLEVDTAKQYCSQEPPHWHLCSKYGRIAQIWIYPSRFERVPGEISNKIRDEVLELTDTYASQIESAYKYNKENGSDY